MDYVDEIAALNRKVEALKGAIAEVEQQKKRIIADEVDERVRADIAQGGSGRGVHTAVAEEIGVSRAYVGKVASEMSAQPVLPKRP
jgi:fumarate hydratase class II